MKSALSLAFLSLLALTLTQDVTVPNYCTPGYTAGSDTALVTLPYTYDQAISIIGSYKNLTWSGNPDSTVSLNGSDNTVGTARTYDTAGAHVIETILSYSKPPAPGPYEEVHNTALLSVPSYNVSFYIMYDGTVVSSLCDGKAVMFNFTAHFCATNASTTAVILHTLHTADAETVGKFLGGENFTTCDAIMAGPSPTASAMPGAYTGGAVVVGWSAIGVLAGVIGSALVL